MKKKNERRNFNKENFHERLESICDAEKRSHFSNILARPDSNKEAILNVPRPWKTGHQFDRSSGLKTRAIFEVKKGSSGADGKSTNGTNVKHRLRVSREDGFSEQRRCWNKRFREALPRLEPWHTDDWANKPDTDEQRSELLFPFRIPWLMQRWREGMESGELITRYHQRQASF